MPNWLLYTLYAIGVIVALVVVLIIIRLVGKVSMLRRKSPRSTTPPPPPSAGSTASTSSAPAPPQEKKVDQWKALKIAGIVIGAVVAIVLVVSLFKWLNKDNEKVAVAEETPCSAPAPPGVEVRWAWAEKGDWGPKVEFTPFRIAEWCGHGARVGFVMKTPGGEYFFTNRRRDRPAAVTEAQFMSLDDKPFSIELRFH